MSCSLRHKNRHIWRCTNDNSRDWLEQTRQKILSRKMHQVLSLRGKLQNREKFDLRLHAYKIEKWKSKLARRHAGTVGLRSSKFSPRETFAYCSCYLCAWICIWNNATKRRRWWLTGNCPSRTRIVNRTAYYCRFSLTHGWFFDDCEWISIMRTITSRWLSVHVIDGAQRDFFYLSI